MHAAFTADTGKPHSSERRAQVTQEPAIHPSDARLHQACHPVSAFQVSGPDRGSKAVFRVICHDNGFFLRVEWRDMTHRSKNLFLHTTGGLRQACQDRWLNVKAV